MISCSYRISQHYTRWWGVKSSKLSTYFPDKREKRKSQGPSKWQDWKLLPPFFSFSLSFPPSLFFPPSQLYLQIGKLAITWVGFILRLWPFTRPWFWKGEKHQLDMWMMLMFGICSQPTSYSLGTMCSWQWIRCLWWRGGRITHWQSCQADKDGPNQKQHPLYMKISIIQIKTVTRSTIILEILQVYFWRNNAEDEINISISYTTQ